LALANIVQWRVMSGAWQAASLIKLEIMKYKLEINVLVLSAVSILCLCLGLLPPHPTP